MTNETDRIECAIRHIQTAVDIDPWAMEIAVEALEKQIPKKPMEKRFCGHCGEGIEDTTYDYCPYCGCAIDWAKPEQNSR